jgi:hypothetical protein
MVVVARKKKQRLLVFCGGCVSNIFLPEDQNSGLRQPNSRGA